MPDVVVNADGSFAIERKPVGTGSAGEAQMVLPGFVNAHSHAFQRCLRGRVEQRSKNNPDDDFWSWREAMYAAANAVSVGDVRALARWCYRDMVRAGVTAVGEFHYLHHPPAGQRWNDPLQLSRAVVDAAHDVGLHITLLETAYARAGHGRPATAAQQRFIFADVEAYLAHLDAVTRELTGPGCVVAAAIHSVRACPRDWIEAIAAAVPERPLHVHACEQVREVVECRAEHGLTPIGLLQACGALTKNTTLVHATHLDDDDIALIAAAGASVCLTPSTERNLGDGLGRINDLHRAGVRLCVGSDSHARIDLVDELRSLEDHERLRLQKRCVLSRPGEHLFRTLVPMGTQNGAEALGLRHPVGSISVPMPLEGEAFGAAVGLDAFFVGGSSNDVDFALDGNGQVILAKDDRFAARDREIDEDALAVLRKLQ